MNRIPLIIVGVCALFEASACSFQANQQQPGGSGGNGGDTVPGTGGVPVVDDGAVFRPDAAIEYIIAPDADPEAGPSTDANCGNLPFSVVIPPPELLIVLDRSRSMNEDAAGMANGGANSKWNLMIAAIKEVVAQTETTINWGLKYFGTDAQCAVADGAAVAPGPNNAMAIATSLNQTMAQSATPTSAGELSAGNYLASRTTMNPKFILLATDGQPTCGPPTFMTANEVDDPGAIAAVTTVAMMGFKTYVIGIATSDASQALANTTLNTMAVMGGTARPAPADPQYYPVSTTADLVGALKEIKSIVMGMCTYPLGTPAPNADTKVITVTVDGVPVMRDVPDGWVYDAGMTSITFTGTTCVNLMAGTSKDVQILYGCKTIVE